MNTSESVNELFTALAKAQGEVKQPSKNATNPHFKSSYSTLDAIQDVSRVPFQKNNLSVLDSLESEGDEYFCESRLCHSSGQWALKKMKLILFKKDMQGIGSAYTYARRYNLMGFLNVFGDEDDDGNAASIPPGQKSSPPSNTPQSSHVKKPPIPKKVPDNFAPAPKEYIEKINGLCAEKQIPEGSLHYLIKTGYGELPHTVKTWQAIEIGNLLANEDTTEGSLLAFAQRKVSERASQEILKGNK